MGGKAAADKTAAVVVDKRGSRPSAVGGETTRKCRLNTQADAEDRATETTLRPHVERAS